MSLDDMWIWHMSYMSKGFKSLNLKDQVPGLGAQGFSNSGHPRATAVKITSRWSRFSHIFIRCARANLCETRSPSISWASDAFAFTRVKSLQK